jgi:hypothetical protein
MGDGKFGLKGQKDMVKEAEFPYLQLTRAQDETRDPLRQNDEGE